MLMYAYDYVGMGSGPQKLICFALKARYEIMLLISFWTSLGIYILDSHIWGRGEVLQNCHGVGHIRPYCEIQG